MLLLISLKANPGDAGSSSVRHLSKRFRSAMRRLKYPHIVYCSRQHVQEEGAGLNHAVSHASLRSAKQPSNTK